MTDPEFLQSVLQSLPGVDPDSAAIRDAVNSISGEEKKKKKDTDKKPDKK
jgi:26S proteasome regulatory subunit N10